jgi:hypothetical protein
MQIRVNMVFAIVFGAGCAEDWEEVVGKAGFE